MFVNAQHIALSGTDGHVQQPSKHLQTLNTLFSVWNVQQLCGKIDTQHCGSCQLATKMAKYPITVQHLIH